MSNEGAGYKKPPKKSQFKPGKSGNPSGRKKKQPANDNTNFKSLSRVIRETLLHPVVVQINGKSQTMLRIEAIMAVQNALAMKGNAQSAKVLIGLAEKHIPTGLTIQELMEGQEMFDWTVEDEKRLRKNVLLEGVIYDEKEDIAKK